MPSSSGLMGELNLITVFLKICILLFFPPPVIQTGTIFALFFCAKTAAPDFGLKNSPVLERVPSINIPKTFPEFKMFSASSRAFPSLFPRLTAKTPMAFKKLAKNLFLKRKLKQQKK